MYVLLACGVDAAGFKIESLKVAAFRRLPFCLSAIPGGRLLSPSKRLVMVHGAIRLNKF